MTSRIVDLRSDILTRPTPRMTEAMAQAALAPAHFGLREDPSQRALEARVAAMLGTQDALLFPTCSMANEVALQVLTSPGDVVLAQPDVHIVTSEGGGPAVLAGVQVVAVPGEFPCPAPDAWEALARQRPDESRPRVAAIVIENTHNRAGGAVLPREWVDAVLGVAKSCGARAHLDGSRIFNAAVARDVAPARLCAGFDTVSVSLNKGLGAPLGAALAGSVPLIARALVFRQRLGGGLRPTGIIAAAALEALSDISHLADDHRRARSLAAALAGIPGLRVDPASVETNIVAVDIVSPGLTPATLCERLGRHGVLALPFGPARVRLVTYRDIGDADIEFAVAGFRSATADR